MSAADALAKTGIRELEGSAIRLYAEYTYALDGLTTATGGIRNAMLDPQSFPVNQIDPSLYVIHVEASHRMMLWHELRGTINAHTPANADTEEKQRVWVLCAAEFAAHMVALFDKEENRSKPVRAVTSYATSVDVYEALWPFQRSAEHRVARGISSAVPDRVWYAALKGVGANR